MRIHLTDFAANRKAFLGLGGIQHDFPCASGCEVIKQDSTGTSGPLEADSGVCDESATVKLPQKRSDWPAEWLELWAERSAIMQFEGGMLQNQAEKEAEEDIRRIVERNFLNV
jgi:hypothetical protein